MSVSSSSLSPAIAPLRPVKPVTPAAKPAATAKPVAPAAKPSPPLLGQKYLMSDSGALSAVAASAGSIAPAKPSASSVSLSPTLVGAAGGLQFNLIWDASVAKAPAGLQNAVIAAALAYTKLYANHEVVNIQVGSGEVGGQAMGAGALGESESYGYMTNYGTVANGLQKDAASSSYQKSADAALTSANPTGSGAFFVTGAEAKTLGLASPASTAVDGFIGISNLYAMDTTTSVAGDKMAANQYDAVGVAEHEISEVMGRIGSVGSLIGSKVYTPLDLFRYSANTVRAVTAGAGYLSADGGRTNLGTYNNPLKGGDAADWIPTLMGDAYGSGYAGRKAVLSSTDIIENALMGYKMTAAAAAATVAPGLA